MKTVKELYSFYQSDLKSLLEPHEKSRKRDVTWFYVVLSLLTMYLLYILIYSFSKTSAPFIIFSLLIFIFLIYYTKYKSKSSFSDNFKQEYKNKILPKLLDFLFDDYEYIANQRISYVVLNKSNLFSQEATSVDGEDFMRFRFGETDIMLSETIAFNIHLNVFFSGVFISASFNKDFNSETFLFSKARNNILKNLEKQIFSEFKKVKLEDSEFENEFLVLSSDQIEARYILTPTLMNRILAYKKKINKSISFSFAKNRLYCAIPNYTNQFEPTIFSPLNYEFIKEVYNQLKVYTDIVEDLHLNLRIWSKE